ncbi:hypothetical protein LX16_4242 [Stackebrandtia albiflava]|uniref:DNA-binding protein n=1 Tax=Stackebrandtia albiflava TaxID=406432 RepID=A0A562UZ51_9ACTN|nr:hypothetical protein [Stackebrandtia albiflava]TWJ10818.1 hypothetical protein LX16_4242 [Stackebrandtia albiflava]
MTSDALLRAGLAPLDAPDGMPLRARTYSHPALGTRPVVRLAGDQVAEAEDRTLEFLGFTEPRISEPLGRIVAGGSGYPAWALINDPDNGRLALSVVPDMERAARKAVASPLDAQAGFTQIAAKLPQTHLPSFWEQAGRAFLDADRAHFAGQMFGRAREVERVHALPVDENLRRAVFLEFALAGALSVKALTEYLNELTSRYDPDTAADSFESLTLGRIRGGLSPWADLPKQWRRLTKSAGRDSTAEERRLLAELLDAAPMRSAPVKFWQQCRASLVALGRSEPRHARSLLFLFPQTNGRQDATAGFFEWWLDLLDDAGALRLLAESDAPVEWMNRAVAELKVSDRRQSAPQRLIDLVKELAPRLTGLDLGSEQRRYNPRINMDLLSVCLTSGVAIKEPDAKAHLGPGDWYASANTEIDPIAADPRFRPMLYRALDRLAGHAEAIRHPKLRPVIEDWITSRAERTVDCGLLDLDAVLPLFTHVELESFPKADRALIDIDVAETLARSLRAGLPGELGWAAFDEAVSELDGRIRMTASWPILTVYSTEKAIAIGPQGRIAEHELRFAGKPSRIIVTYSDDAFMVVWNVSYSTNHFYWSHDPARVEELKTSWIGDRSEDQGYHLLNPQGRLLSRGEVLHRGQDTLEAQRWKGLTDGETFWSAANHSWDVHEIDPATGELGRVSFPSFFDDAERPAGHKWSITYSSLVALPGGIPGSPLGSRGDLMGFRVSTGDDGHAITGVDGRHATLPTGHSIPWALIDIPGVDSPRMLTGTGRNRLVDPQGRAHSTIGIGGREAPPKAFWHFMTPRDPESSKILRDIDRETAWRLIKAAHEDIETRRDESEDRKPARLETELSEVGITHERIRDHVAAVVREATRMARNRELMLKPENAPTKWTPSIDRQGLSTGLSGLRQGDNVYNDNTAEVFEAQIGFLAGTIGSDDAAKHAWQRYGDWTDLLGRFAALAVRAVSPAFDESARNALRRMLTLAAESPITSGDVRIGAMTSGEHVGVRNADGALITTTTIRVDGVTHYVFLEVGRPERPAVSNELRAVTTGWGASARIKEFLAAVERQPVVEVDPAAVALLSERTGMSSGAATLLLTGLPRVTVYETHFLDADTRKRLGLTSAAAQSGRATVRRLRQDDALDFYEEVLGDDPTILWDQPRFAAGLAEAWVKRHGRSVPLSEETRAQADKIGLSHGADSVLRFFTDGDRAFCDKSGLLSPRELNDVQQAACWAYASLPEGDPVRDGIPRALAAAHADVADESQLFGIGYLDVPDDLLSEDERHIAQLGRTAYDGGLVVAEQRGRRQSRTYFRPARLTDDSAGTALRAIDYTGVVRLVDWFRSPDAADIAARIGKIPAGRYEADPRASVPHLVAEARDDLGLSEEAATLYLQLLALPEPTDRNVRTWNGWTPARHKKAIAELLEKELVVAAKRSRAGRGVFLPGGWQDLKAPAKPRETWKEPLYPAPPTSYYASSPLVNRPLTELFTQAWRRHTSGEGPR